LPPAASFDPETASFSWTPAEYQLGRHKIEFSATNAGGVTSAASVLLDIQRGVPAGLRLRNIAGDSAPAACVPGAAVSVTGSFLAIDGATRVLANGQDAEVLRAGAETVEFLCPSGAPGSPLSIVVETAAGTSAPLQTVMASAAPGVLTARPSRGSQALAYSEATMQLAALPTSALAGQPIRAGETISVLATGIDCGGVAPLALLHFGADVVVTGEAHPDYAGFCRVTAMVPAGISGARVPLQLEMREIGGTPVLSNAASIAVEN
jgi:uncharacterized protein (TIGR03437 family)